MKTEHDARRQLKLSAKRIRKIRKIFEVPLPNRHEFRQNTKKGEMAQYVIEYTERYINLLRELDEILKTGTARQDEHKEKISRGAERVRRYIEERENERTDRDQRPQDPAPKSKPTSR